MFGRHIPPITWVDFLRAQAEIAAETGAISLLPGSWEDHWLPNSARGDDIIISERERSERERQLRFRWSGL